jgi:uncharacterized membrane protein YgdD (TMEM256/DUF423 family)
MKQSFIRVAAILAALAIGLGAFGAHGLKDKFSAGTMNIFETGVRYQLYHAIALLLTGILYGQFPGKRLDLAGILFITGIVLFSGSLYALCYTQYANLSMNWMGAITPFGGLAFIFGWLCIAAAVTRKKTA